jgi:integrase
MDWAREQTDRRLVYATHRGTVIASSVLRQRDDEGLLAAALDHRDADRVVDAIRAETSRSGTETTGKHKRRLYTAFFQLIEHGRRTGQLESLPTSFGTHASHVFGAAESEEKVGKAIPDHVQRQLDMQLDDLGRDSKFYRALSTRQRQLMFRTAYILLRDTGRRPLEIASLQRSCLTRDSNGPILIWDNHNVGPNDDCPSCNPRLMRWSNGLQPARRWQLGNPHRGTCFLDTLSIKSICQARCLRQ